MTILKDGKGTGNTAKVRANRLFTHSVTESEAFHAGEEGDAYNINTGDVSLTSATNSSIMYLKNNEVRDLVIEAVAVGLGSAATVTDSARITLVRNPISVDYSTDVDMNQNRNFGSSKTLAVDAFKGVEGSASTGGNSIAQFYAGEGSRLFAGINFILPKGDSMAIEIDPNISAGTMTAYAAVVCFLKEDEFSD